MGKHRRKLGISLRPARFFKVFIPDQSSQRLKLPSAFAKNFECTTPFKSTIISPTKRSWEIDLEKVGDNLYFHDGWEQLVQQNSLEFGDFLVFVYNNDATFNVTIYGKNGCEKEPTYPTREHPGVLSTPKENQLVKKEDGQANHFSAFEEADKFKSDLPFFKIIMRPSYVRRGHLNIPSRFTKRHMTADAESATLIYLDKSWPVTVYSRKRETEQRETERTFSTGSATFIKDNHLKAGDVCLFEFVDKTPDFVYNFKVSIFRC